MRVVKKKLKYIPQYRTSKSKTWTEFSKGETIFEFDTRPEALDFIIEQTKTHES